MTKKKQELQISYDVKNILERIEGKFDAFSAKNDEDHAAICKRLDITNGKVKKSTALATLAITLFIVVLGFFFQHINK